MINELRELGVTHSSQPAWPLARVYPEPATTFAGSIDLSDQTAGWVLEAAAKLEALGRFQPGWDSYSGLPLQRSAKDLTVRTLRWLRSDELPVPAVVLGSGGTVQLEWRTNDKELEVELRDNNTIEYVKVSSGGAIEEGEVTADLSAKLHDLSRWLLLH